MSDNRTKSDDSNRHDLRTVTARLTDLQRKCRSAGARNDEANEMEARLASVLARLQPDPGDDVPIPFVALARELYAVERFFESNGFIGVAKEVAHVERALQELAGDEEPDEEPSTPVDGTLERALERPEELDDDVDAVRSARWAVPAPVAVVLVILVIAIAVCGAVIWRMQHPAPVAETVSADLSETPAPPAAEPAPEATPSGPRPPATPAPGAVLAGAIGNARLAIADGDVDGAIDHLSRAALVDPNHATVLGTANQLVELLVDRADGAADGGLWEIAEITLTRAERLATRFGLDTQRIIDSRQRYARMDRFRLVKPSDPTAIRAASGMRVTVFMKDGSTRESVIKGAEGGQLLLDEDSEVRGGAMYYTERIPLVDIDYLKVWE